MYQVVAKDGLGVVVHNREWRHLIDACMDVYSLPLAWDRYVYEGCGKVIRYYKGMHMVSA